MPFLSLFLSTDEQYKCLHTCSITITMFSTEYWLKVNCFNYTVSFITKNIEDIYSKEEKQKLQF